MASAGTPVRSRAALIASPPRSAAEKPASEPESFPIGVRAPPRMTDPAMVRSPPRVETVVRAVYGRADAVGQAASGMQRSSRRAVSADDLEDPSTAPGGRKR